MTRDNIIKNILLKIDEISPFSEPDDQMLGMIDGMLDDCANNYLRIIPKHLIRGQEKLFDNSKLLHSESVDGHIGLGYWQAEEDFLRMTRCLCTHWLRTVTDISNSNELYHEYDKFTRAGNAKPRVYIETQNGIRYLVLSPYYDFYVPQDFKLFYIPKVVAQEIADEILDPFFYYAASNILTSQQRIEFAQVMLQKMQELIIARQ